MLVEGCWLTLHRVNILAGIDARIKVAKDLIWREICDNNNAVIILFAHKCHQAVRGIVDNLDKAATLIGRVQCLVVVIEVAERFVELCKAIRLHCRHCVALKE